MIFKNETTDVRVLSFIRIFFIAFALFLTFFLGKPLVDFFADDWVGILLGLFVPIMFYIIILFEACVTKYIDCIEISAYTIKIKHGNGYINKTILLNKKEILSFNVDIIAVNRWYYTRYRRKYITFDVIINIYMNNGKKIFLKDTHSGLELTKLLCLVQNKIPNFKFVSTLHNSQDADIVKQLEQVKSYYNELLNNA